MMGRGLCSLLLSLCLTLSTLERGHSKPVALPRIPDQALPEHVISRFRRQILPYEGEMFASHPGDPGLYPQPLGGPSVLAQLTLSPGELQQLERQALRAGLRPSHGSLDRALPRPPEAGDRREQAEAYAAGLLRAWEQLGRSAAYLRPGPRGGYLDYSGPGSEGGEGEGEEEEEEGGDGARGTEERLLAYLVGRILEELGARREPTTPRGPAPRRFRRALEGARGSLVRVKRVGAEEEGEEGEGWAGLQGAQLGEGRPFLSGHLARRVARLLLS